MYHQFIIDVPHEFATEQGTIKSRYAFDFRDSKDCYENTWRCPVTRLLMLKPSFLDRRFEDGFRELGQWRQGQSAIRFWREVQRSAENLSMFTSRRPAGETKYFPAITTAAALFTLNASDAFYDNLEWALESKFTIGVDGCFGIDHHALTDELMRKTNFCYVQWDDIGIHISHAGHVTVVKYPDRGNLATAPQQVHEFDICDPGDLLGKHGAFIFLPIPHFGLIMYHINKPSRLDFFRANSAAFSVSGGHMIPWDKRLAGSHYRLFETSMVRIALNPFHANLLGFQDVTFPASGSYIDETFDPGYRPTLAPADVSPLVFNSFSQNFATTSAQLRKTDNSDVWAVGTDRQGRVKMSLASSDDRYTPFIYGWGAQWVPVIETRNTTPITINTGYSNVVQRIEINDDSEGNVEGSARLKLQSEAAIKIAERGDTTWEHQVSDDGVTWTTYAGGIARISNDGLDMEYHPDWGYFCWVDLDLHGMEERFEEMVMRTGTAFDGMTLAEAINLVLITFGFSAIPEADFPGVAQLKRIPALPKGGGTEFRFAPKGGQKGKKILRDLMLIIRAQWIECKMTYDWVNEVWECVQRERNPSTGWSLTYDPSDENHGSKVAYYTSLKLNPQPPEGNVLVAVGLTGSDPNTATRVESAPIPGKGAPNPSLTDTTSVDYLGRVVGIQIVARNLSDQNALNMLARQVAPRALHRNITATVMLAPGHSPLTISPDTYISLVRPPIVGTVGDRTLGMWVKKRTLVIDSDEVSNSSRTNEKVILHLDEIWENEFRGEG